MRGGGNGLEPRAAASPARIAATTEAGRNGLSMRTSGGPPSAPWVAVLPGVLLRLLFDVRSVWA